MNHFPSPTFKSEMEASLSACKVFLDLMCGKGGPRHSDSHRSTSQVLWLQVLAIVFSSCCFHRPSPLPYGWTPLSVPLHDSFPSFSFKLFNRIFKMNGRERNICKESGDPLNYQNQEKSHLPCLIKWHCLGNLDIFLKSLRRHLKQIYWELSSLLSIQVCNNSMKVAAKTNAYDRINCCLMPHMAPNVHRRNKGK